jgi:hypothetical protein
MNSPEDMARAKRRKDRTDGIKLIVGGIVMMPVSIVLSMSAGGGMDFLCSGLAVWTFVAIVGVYVYRRGAEK